jgi:hypothetical protein
MTAKHTPGPWFTTKSSDHNAICHVGRRWIIGSTLALSHFGDVDADAKLLAAAPDLLEALKNVIAGLSMGDDEGLIEYAEQMIAARAAIAKATA